MELHDTTAYTPMGSREGKVVTTEEHTELAQPYWGIQKLTSFPKPILEEISSGKRYVDLTAGGGGMVFHRSNFQRVHGNDRNAYAAAGYQTAQAIQSRGCKLRDFHGWAADIHPEALNWRLYPGYLSSLSEGEWDRFYPSDLSDDVKQYVDALCNHGPMTAYFTTRTLMDAFTVRCRAWDKRDPLAENDIYYLYDQITRIGRRWYQLLATRNEITGTNVSAEQCASFVRRGDVVYTDPAWPWDPTQDEGGFDQDNPYDFLTCAAGSILKQDHIRPDGIPFWLAKNGPEPIWDDVASWVKGAFEGGAKSFILSTQGTNWPSPDLTLHEVAERAGVKLTHYQYEVVTTRRSHTKFTEWFGIMEEMS
jgi:hypothetical protein